MKKFSNAFFSETTIMIKVKLYMNVHWVVFYKFEVFCSDMKFKMAATDRHIKEKLCRGPSNDHSWAVWFQLSKWFQRRSVLKHFSHSVQKVSLLYADRKSKMAVTAGHILTLAPMGKCSNAFFSETTNMMNIHVQFGFNHICSF
jgi:hypothetical protein